MAFVSSAQGRLRSASITELLFACLGFNSTYNYITSFTQRILDSPGFITSAIIKNMDWSFNLIGVL